MSWQPQEVGLRQVITFLKLSQCPDNSSQNIVKQQLQELNDSSDICYYYAYILTKVNEDEASRSLSGLVLKNHLKRNYYLTNSEVLEYVKDTCLAGLRDPSYRVRSSSALVISTIVVKGGLMAWPQLLPQLCHMMDSPDYSSCEGALNTFEKICEDARELHSMSWNDTPLNTLIPMFIKFFRHPSRKLRCHAISCIIFFVICQNPVFLRHIDLFMEGLTYLATDKDEEVCKKVCCALSHLLQTEVDRLIPHLNGIVEFMLTRTQDSDESLALEGSELWHYLTDSQICKEVLKPHLPRLVPLLINNMKLSTIEILVFKGDREDVMIPDSDQDIRPRFYRQRDAGVGNCGDAETSDEEDYGVESLLDRWNLRKSSAATLGNIARVFSDDVLPIILPLLNETILHSDWILQESGILALGAIAEGCFYGMVPHLNVLIPFLINCMTSERSLIRVTTCRTVSRYFKWVLSDPTDHYLKPLLSRLLERMLDSNKIVQQSACSALAELAEEAGTKLVPYLSNIIQTLVTVFPNYKRKNLAILYDAVGTLARFVGNNLNNQHFIDMLMPRVIEKLSSTQDDDKYILSLFQCVACIATALQDGLWPYSGPVFERCLTLIEKTLDPQIVETDESEYCEKPDKDIAICALDLIGSIVGAIKERVETVVVNSNLMKLLYKCMQDTTPGVRQNSCALLGNIARACFPSLRPVVGKLIPILCQNCNPIYVSVCENAIRSLGEICTKLSVEEIRPCLHGITQCLMSVIQTENCLLVGIAAVTLCRFGCFCPEDLAHLLHMFAKQWCISICTTRDRVEKESSFRGMCQIMMVNPCFISQELFYFSCAAASLSYPDEPVPADLRELIGKTLQGFKSQSGQQEWQIFCSRFPPQTLEHLVANYQI